MAETTPPGLEGIVQHRYAQVGSHRYHYLHAKPSGKLKGTFFLFHGFPDISYGWRYQITLLHSLGYEVVAADMLGFGRSSAPTDLKEYAAKLHADEMATLAGRVAPGQRIFAGGHDFGVFVAYRLAIYHPDLVQGLFVAAIPFLPLETKFEFADRIGDESHSAIGYMRQFGGPEFHKNFVGQDKIWHLLSACYNGTTPEGEPGGSPEVGLILDRLPRIGLSPIVTEEELAYIVSEYGDSVQGPFNWYRLSKINFDADLPAAEKGNIRFKMPTLFVAGKDDPYLPPSITDGMKSYFDDLELHEVDGTHWVLWDARDKVNELLTKFLSRFTGLS
ncbi:uncharacterized protein NECHADRAFT_51532 [Fusarium vanettenii 77-13-4]|uniref:AB hydrolase-1 domain-containing protein n=1 Tax=Fusarium vanettenii (strain ATCC MYA-4622 / CBS 123669 / FGSC 9596 / NRRL 45880 / 77-13-4) TaxID=660122 RepID=C7ZES2_FUSV7|nr:uncharacterized protein NECHADRAFT_51532 [Fusarium vanettenii 77-13-4]EEU37425.1 hypothetical protein NECHADRAFT_51532 [Fusarium vanettenii 77-13-4]